MSTNLQELKAKLANKLVSTDGNKVVFYNSDNKKFVVKTKKKREYQIPEHINTLIVREEKLRNTAFEADKFINKIKNLIKNTPEGLTIVSINNFRVGYKCGNDVRFF